MKTITLILSILLATGLNSSHAQDHPCNAYVLSFGTNGPFNTAVATIDNDEVAPPDGECSVSGYWCDNTISNTLWFSFTAPASGNVTIQSPGFDTQIALWKVTDCSNYATFTLLDANDDDPYFDIHGAEEFSSYMGPYTCAQQLTPDATYYVQLDPYDAPGSTTIVLTDAGTPLGSTTYYSDNDGDSYGDISNSFLVTDCVVPDNYVLDSTDCNDNNAAIHPGICDDTNGVDDDCNGVIDYGSGAIIYYADADGDGYGTGTPTSLCSNPGAGYSMNNIDCNDADSFVNPAATEITNGIDDDCNGDADEQFSWVQKSDFAYNIPNVPEPSARYGATGFSIGSKGYIGTGYNYPIYYKDFWEFNPATNTWTQKADFGGSARAYAAGFSIGNKGYIGVGYNGAYEKDFWEYDPVTNTWTQKANFKGSARSRTTGFSIGSKGYIGVGYDGHDKKDFWEYDPYTNNWTKKADFGGTAREFAAGFSLDNKGYIGTGYTYGVGHTRDFWEYDPVDDEWTQKADFGGTARYESIGFSIGVKGYIGTGNAANGAQRDFWEYDPTSNIWLQKADFGGLARYQATGFSIETRGYIGTGIFYGAMQDFWEYDPVTISWTKKADFGSTITCSYASGFSIGSKGYIGTGVGNNGLKKDFWEYDPAADIWTQKADFGGSARGSAIGFSIDDKGYIGTGYDINNTNRKDFWEYDPLTNTWTQIADFGGTARYDATGFSIGSKGYVGTGINSYFAQYIDFWEYDPGTNIWKKKADFAGGIRYGATGFGIGNKGYMGTGVGFGNVSDFWEYDPATNSWTKKADFGGSPRSYATGFNINSKGYIGMGWINGATYKDFWEYNPLTNVWTKKADFEGAARGAAVGFSIGDKGYIGTGNSSYQYEINYKDFWEYASDGGISVCGTPTLPSTVNITSSAAKLKWDAVSGPIGYKVRFKIAGTSQWTITQSADNNKTLNGLDASTEYAWQVKSICGVSPIVPSEWSEKQFFTTDDLRLSESMVHETTLEVYPNPVSQSATVSFFLTQGSSVVIELTGVNGRSLRVIVDADFSEGNHELTFNRESLSAGVYFLQMKTNEGVMMKKVVVE